MKLYKRVENEIHYWETWDVNNKTGATHAGIVGQKGEYNEIKSGLFSNFRKEIQKQIDKAKENLTAIQNIEDATTKVKNTQEEIKLDALIEESKERLKLCLLVAMVQPACSHLKHSLH